jgi:hypothetical protein
MSTKAKAIENANKRLLTESLPPPVHFSDGEVFGMFWEAFGENTPEELIKAFQNALKKKCRIFSENEPQDPTKPIKYY